MYKEIVALVEMLEREVKANTNHMQEMNEVGSELDVMYLEGETGAYEHVIALLKTTLERNK